MITTLSTPRLQERRANLAKAPGELAAFDIAIGHACNPGNVASEDGMLRHGAYTEALLHYLDRPLPVFDVLQKAAARTVEVHNAKQRPSVDTNFHRDFSLSWAPAAPSATPPACLAPALPGPSQCGSQCADEEAVKKQKADRLMDAGHGHLGEANWDAAASAYEEALYLYRQIHQVPHVNTG